MNRSVLIIEDEPALRILLTDYLESEGFRVEAAADGAAALRLDAANDFSVAFVDINLPDISGDEVMREMRAKGSTTKLIVLSGNLRESYEHRIQDLDIYEVLEKPVDLLTISDLADSAARGEPPAHGPEVESA